MSFLAWDDWERADNWEGDMDLANWQGVSFSDLLRGAMIRLNSDLAAGNVLREANALIAANAPVGFTSDQMIALLGRGEFRYRQRVGIVHFPQLEIHGPHNGTPASVNGRVTQLNDFDVYINFPTIINWANANPTIIPAGQTGRECLEIYIGKTILHETMHNHGFTHPGGQPPAFSPADPHYRTLPEVAEHAFYNIYRASHFGGAINALPLTGGTFGPGDIGGMYCGFGTNEFESANSDPKVFQQKFTQFEAMARELFPSCSPPARNEFENSGTYEWTPSSIEQIDQNLNGNFAARNSQRVDWIKAGYYDARGTFHQDSSMQLAAFAIVVAAKASGRSVRFVAKQGYDAFQVIRVVIQPPL